MTAVISSRRRAIETSQIAVRPYQGASGRAGHSDHAGIRRRYRCGYAALRPSPYLVRSRSLMLSQDIVDSLFPPDLPEPDHWEYRYPPRDLPEGAKVTRIAPSPTEIGRASCRERV